MELTIVYDMRAPAFGAKAADLYAAPSIRWRGRTNSVSIVGSVSTTPPRMATTPLRWCWRAPWPDAAGASASAPRCCWHRSMTHQAGGGPGGGATGHGGRMIVGIGAGYRREFEMFAGASKTGAGGWRDVSCVEAGVDRRAVHWQGRRCCVTPRPDRHHRSCWRRYGCQRTPGRAHADGWFPPLDPKLWRPTGTNASSSASPTRATTRHRGCLPVGLPRPGA